MYILIINIYINKIKNTRKKLNYLVELFRKFKNKTLHHRGHGGHREMPYLIIKTL